MEQGSSLQIEQHPVRQFWKGRGGFMPVAIVEHMMQGQLEEVWRFFDGHAGPEQYKVSAHYGIARDGRVWQFVDEQDTAWANGVVQDPDISIGWLKEVYEEKVNCNLVTLAIQYEGYSGEPLSEAQYRAALDLHSRLVRRWEIPVDRHHIIGQASLDRRERFDNPGPAFPWQRLLDDLKRHQAADAAAEAIPAQPAAAGPEAAGAAFAVGLDDGAAVQAEPPEPAGGAVAQDEIVEAVETAMAEESASPAAATVEAGPDAEPDYAVEARPPFDSEPPEIVNLDVNIPFSSGVNDELEYAIPAVNTEIVSSEVDGGATEAETAEPGAGEETGQPAEDQDQASGAPEETLTPEQALEQYAEDRAGQEPARQPQAGQEPAGELPAEERAGEEDALQPFSFDPQDLVDDLPAENEAAPAGHPFATPAAMHDLDRFFSQYEQPVKPSDPEPLPDFIFDSPDFNLSDLTGDEAEEAEAEAETESSGLTAGGQPKSGQSGQEVLYPFDTPISPVATEQPDLLYPYAVPLGQRPAAPPDDSGGYYAEEAPVFNEPSAGSLNYPFELPPEPARPNLSKTPARPAQRPPAGLEAIPDEFFASPVEEAASDASARPARPAGAEAGTQPAAATLTEDETGSPDQRRSEQTRNFRLVPAVPRPNEGWQDFLFDTESIFDDTPIVPAPTPAGELTAEASPATPASDETVAPAGDSPGAAATGDAQVDLRADKTGRLPVNPRDAIAYTAPLSYQELDLSIPEDLEREQEQARQVAFRAASIGRGQVTVELANIRRRPSFDRDTIVRVIELGQTLSFDGWAEGPELHNATRWYHIAGAGGEADEWIHSSLVRLERPFNP